MSRIAKNIVFIALTSMLFLKILSTYVWRMENDPPLLHYAAYLMLETGRIPYRDIFETSMPGTFAFHYAIGSTIGFGDAAFRLVDVLLLAAIMGATYHFMLRFGRYAAAWSCIWFGITYLSKGQVMTLQRDYIGIFPLALALCLIPREVGGDNGKPEFWRAFLLGGLFGCAALIKPHLLISLPFLFGSLLVIKARLPGQKTARIIFQQSIALMCGLLLLPAYAAYWLYLRGALPSFVDVAVNYLPMHTAISGHQVLLFGAERIKYLLQETISLAGYRINLLISLVAVFLSLKSTGEYCTRVAIFCIAACCVAYAIYPSLAGKFWLYHYMPLAYFCAISTGLFFSKTMEFYAGDRRGGRLWLMSAYGLLLILFIKLPIYTFVSTAFSDFGENAADKHKPISGRVDEMTKWLQPRLKPGDSVQPLDWTGGSIHAMLKSHAILATKFMYDYHFYHHINSPYTNQLRSTFMRQLSASSPRFIIEVDENKPWVSGEQTSRAFPELRKYIKDEYSVAFIGHGYSIYERRDP